MLTTRDDLEDTVLAVSCKTIAMLIGGMPVLVNPDLAVVGCLASLVASQELLSCLCSLR